MQKMLHFIWCGETPPDDRSFTPSQWRDLNPEWSVTEWNDRSLSAFLLKTYPQYWVVFKSLRQPVKRSDLARLLLLRRFGGGYIDYDLIPVRGLDEFFTSKVILHQRCRGDVRGVNLHSYNLILTREYRHIDGSGHGVANGVIFSRRNNPTIKKFVLTHCLYRRRAVLDYLGPWAFTRFLRRERPKNTLVLPPHYFLHEMSALGEPTEITVAIHPTVNTWGNTARPDWWNV